MFVRAARFEAVDLDGFERQVALLRRQIAAGPARSGASMREFDEEAAYRGGLRLDISVRSALIPLLPVLLCAGFLAACGSGGDHRARTFTIRPVTVQGHTITRVVIPATVITTGG